jgi:hypothetical protein
VTTAQKVRALHIRGEMRASLRVCAQAFSAVIDQVVSMRDRERARDGSVNILSCALCEYSLTKARDRFLHKGFSQALAQLGRDTTMNEAMRTIQFVPAEPLFPSQTYGIILQHCAAMSPRCHADVVIPSTTLTAAC